MCLCGYSTHDNSILSGFQIPHDRVSMFTCVRVCLLMCVFIPTTPAVLHALCPSVFVLLVYVCLLMCRYTHDNSSFSRFCIPHDRESMSTCARVCLLIWVFYTYDNSGFPRSMSLMCGHLYLLVHVCVCLCV